MHEHKKGMNAQCPANADCSPSAAALAVKHLLDRLLAAISLLFFSPLFLIIYIAIKIEGRGPAIFKQKRVGQGEKTFKLYKFRSMIVEAEADGQPALCQKDDKRLTKLGRFLREHHLDELPQLWNVIKGEMSFVGYRPERRYYIDQIVAIDPQYELLYKMRPGLFSMATLYNGYTDTMEKMIERLHMDLEYQRTWSLWQDIKIITLTTLSIVTGKKF